jgi:RecA DNA recombination protein
MASPLLPIETHDFAGVLETKSASLLRELARKSPQAGITSASHLEIRPSPETGSSGIRQVDALTGGLPRGCLTEVSGADSSGRTSLMISALAAATCREEICALIDVSDAFDPNSAAAAGVDLRRLLWVRCGSHAQGSALSRRRRQPASLEEWERRRMEDPVEQALRATDLLLQSSGFGMVVIDLAGTVPKMARRIPLTTWFRFRRAVENTPAILLVIGTEFCAQSCASLAVEINRQEKVLSSRFSVLSTQCSFFKEEHSNSRGEGCRDQDMTAKKPLHTELLTEIEIQLKVVRSRSERKAMQSVGRFATKTAWTA